VTWKDEYEWDVEDEPADFDDDELGTDPDDDDEEEREEGDEPDDERDRR
jgi:hypothetical protein